MTRELRVGFVAGYDPRAGSASVELEEGELHLGDLLRIRGRATDLQVPVRTLRILREPIEEAFPGDVVGFPVPEIVRPDDDVFLVR